MLDGPSRDTLRIIAGWYRWRFRLHERRARIEWREETGEWNEYSATDQAYMIEEIRSHYAMPGGKKPKPLEFSRPKMEQAVMALCRENRVDPYADYLRALPAWDGLDRLENLLAIMYGSELTPLAKWGGRWLYLAPVQRCLEPGSELQQIPILTGPENVGKTTNLRWLFPKRWRKEWCRLGFHIETRYSSAQKNFESMAGAVICEWGEIAGIRRADLPYLKAWITNDQDHVRLPYEPRAITHLRNCAIIASANPTNLGILPSDGVGGVGRRWVILDCPAKMADARPYLNENRDQLAAEAVARFERGERANLPDELLLAAAQANEPHRDTDSLEAALAWHVSQHLSIMAWRTEDLAKSLGLCKESEYPDRGTEMRLAAAMRQIGWVKIRQMTDGVREYLYVREKEK